MFNAKRPFKWVHEHHVSLILHHEANQGPTELWLNSGPCKAIGWPFPRLSSRPPANIRRHPSQFSLSRKQETEINSKSCFSSSFLLSENYLWGKISELPPAPPPTLSPQSLSVVDSLMAISVRISVLQNGKRSMTSSESMFRLYHSWGSAAVDRVGGGRGCCWRAGRGQMEAIKKKNGKALKDVWMQTEQCGEPWWLKRQW